MRSFLILTHALIAAIDCLNEWIGRAVAWLTLGMVLTTFAVVILRYAFNFGSVAMQESVLYMHALVFMLGAAYTLKHNAHVRVDILHQRCGEKLLAWIELFGTLLLLMPLTLYIFWISWPYVGDAWAIRESSRDAGGLPAVYLLKTSMLVMAALLLLQGVAVALISLLRILGQPVPSARKLI